MHKLIDKLRKAHESQGVREGILRQIKQHIYKHPMCLVLLDQADIELLAEYGVR